MDPLVSTSWLADHLHDPELVVLDCTVWLQPSESGYTSVSGLPDHEAGHIPGAGFADLTGDLCDNSGSIRFDLPSPEQFCAAMEKLGVGDDSRVVLYDRAMSMWAARVWWMLRWVGFDRAALLDGGFRAWQDEGRPISTEPADRQPGNLTPRPRPRVVTDRHEVMAAISDDSVSLIDALGESQFRGEEMTYRRPGHIPGATNTPAMALIDPGSGRYRPLEELATMFPGDRSARTVTYCGGGIAASSDAFTLVRLGYEDVAVYTASLQEWAADDSNPLVTETGSPTETGTD
ncbi:MAG TPA: sulfurtransferase [Acidimicrobiales bacterium]|nr:sulfurtransferase [Acidimicrobiales bacterium]